MATAKQFLEALERQKLVSDDLIDRLYEQYRDSGGAVTAESLAETLVSAGALPPATASRLVQAPSDSFIQVGSGILAPKPKSQPVVADPFESELASRRARGGVERDGAGRRKHVKKTHKNDFDSPLLLLGGGALALLTLGGIGLFVAMSLQSGEQLLASAEAAYAAGSYSQAQDEYARFVEDYAGNTRWSEARVKLAAVRLRQLVETARDWDGALAAAQRELPQVEDEPAFFENRGEFASLLPRVARGLAEAADAASASGGAGVASLTEQAKAALGLVGNTKYVPKSLRDEREVGEVTELLARVARRSEAADDLRATLATIEAATSAGNLEEVYAARAAFVVRRPELRDEPELSAKLAAAVEAERTAVRVVTEKASAVTDEPASAVALALPLADARRAGKVAAQGVYTVSHGGAIYALDAEDGSLTWRRPVGKRVADDSPAPVGPDLLLIDHRRGELVRVESATGRLVWRSPLGEAAEGGALGAVATTDAALVAGESGRVAAFDLATGERRGRVEFAQPLRARGGVDAARGKAYFAGAQSSLYTIDTRTLECVGVRHTGHGPGTVTVPPVALGGRVLLIDNAGARTARVRVYATDEAGVVAEQLSEWPLEGVVSTPAVVSGRRVLVTTEVGSVALFEVNAGADGPPVTLVAARTGTAADARRCVAAVTGGDVWVASRGLERTSASLADSQLITQDLPDDCRGDLFIGAIEGRGDAVLHSRVRSGCNNVTVAATSARTGELVWETDLATPPLGPPRFDPAAQGVVSVLADGAIHVVGPQEVRNRVSTRPAARAATTGAFDATVAAAGGTALVRRGDSEWFATFSKAGARARSIALPSPLAAAPTAMGDGLLVPLRIGQVMALDLAGQPTATPYQPRIVAGSETPWTAPIVGELGGQTIAVLTDGAATATCLELVRGESPALAPRGSLPLPTSPADSAPAIAAGRVAVLLKNGDLSVADLPALGRVAEVTVTGAITWGPYGIGDLVLVATAEKLVGVRLADAPQIAWQVDLAGESPVGAPLAEGSGFLVSLGSGKLSRRNATDGAETASIDLGEAVASGPTAYGSRLLVSAIDGTVLVVNQP